MRHKQSAQDLACQQSDHHRTRADLGNQPRNREDQAGAHNAGRQEDRVDLLERTERAVLPSGQSDRQSADCANTPEKGVADAGVVQHTAHFSVHRQMNSQHHSEKHRKHVKMRLHLFALFHSGADLAARV